MAKKKNTLIWVVVGLVVLALIAGSGLAAIFFISKQFTARRGAAYDAVAKSTLRNAVSAAEIYATDHDGSYSGMNAAALSEIEPSIEFTDGAPDENVVSVDASADSYSLAVSSKGGKVLKATMKAGQGVVFDDGAKD